MYILFRSLSREIVFSQYRERPLNPWEAFPKCVKTYQPFQTKGCGGGGWGTAKARCSRCPSPGERKFTGGVLSLSEVTAWPWTSQFEALLIKESTWLTIVRNDCLPGIQNETFLCKQSFSFLLSVFFSNFFFFLFHIFAPEIWNKIGCMSVP